MCANGVNKSVSEESVDFMTESDEEGIPHFESEEELEGLHKMMVFDLRSYTAALGNRAKGGGCECTGECVWGLHVYLVWYYSVLLCTMLQ